MSFFNELKRRNVFRVGIAYAVAAWLLLQLTDVLVDLLGLPEIAGKYVVLLLVIGFIPALIFAFTRDGSSNPSGGALPHAPATPGVARKLSSLLILLPVGASLVGAGLLATREGVVREFPCWGLPQVS